MDGGIGILNVEDVAKAGANMIVSGTGVFGHKDPKEAIRIMHDSVERYLN